MAEKYRESDYLYGSARIRALEGQRIGKDRLERMLEANTSDDVMAMLSDHGFTWSGTDGASREECLLSALSEGYVELERSADGVRSPVRFLRYPYDCNNVKALIKCFARGIAPDTMLFDSLGTVSAEQAKIAFESKDYRMFPPCMAKAISEAEESFAQTGNPQTVDLILDKACYADMLEDTRQSGIAYAVRLVEAKIDLTNLITCLRLIRMNSGAAADAFLQEVLLSGGMLDRTLFTEALAAGEQSMVEHLTYSRYAGFAALLAEESPLHALEKWADDFWMELARDAKFVPFGAEVLIGYAIALEYEVKNIRILLAGKDAGLASDVIRERLRKSYV